MNAFQSHSQFPQFDRNAYANGWTAFHGHPTNGRESVAEYRRSAGNACMNRCVELTDTLPEAIAMFQQLMAVAERDC